jgi:drug/metabolite transporter (DMT)-like permease
VVVVGGVMVVGLSQLDSESEAAFFGLVFICLGEVLQAFQFIQEEYFYDRFDVEPVRLVGLEGLFASATAAVLLTILQFTECSHMMCTHGRMEDTFLAIRQMRDNPTIFKLHLCCLVSVAVFNVSSNFVTKYGSATQRAVTDNCRTVLIWSYFLSFGNSHTHETFDLVQLGGFVMIVLGSLVYNEIVVLNCWKFGANTREKRESLPESRMVESEFESELSRLT